MSDITEKFDKMGIIIKIEESNDCYYCNVFRNGKMVEIPFKYYETPEDAFDETVNLIRYMVLNELKERFHNASQYHLKESEKYKFIDTSNKFNYHLGVSFGYGYAERELDNVIKEFNELIEQDWTKPRGYNLQTIEDVSFPTPFNEGI